MSRPAHFQEQKRLLPLRYEMGQQHCTERANRTPLQSPQLSPRQAGRIVRTAPDG